ncbi:MAG: histidine kinase N-terminal 7TM domain-containing protein [Chloroflexota bacterium]
MYWYLTAVTILLLFSAAPSVIFALFAWKRRPVPGSVAFSVFMLAITLWTLTYVLQFVSEDMAAKLTWMKWQYLGVAIVPVAWLSFTAQYTNKQKWLSSRHWLLVMLFPIVTLALVFTNAGHLLVWIEAQVSTNPWLPVLLTRPGAWYWFTILFVYGAFLTGSLWLLMSTRYEIASLSPHQTLLVLTGLALPWFGGVLHLTSMSFIDLTPLMFALCGMIVGKYALGFQLVKRSPLTRQPALNSLADGVLVVDTGLVIVDANPAMAQIAAQMEKRPFPALVGSQLSDVFPEIARVYNTLKQNPVDIKLNQLDQNHSYEIQRTPILDWRKIVSTDMLIFRDISKRKQQEELHNEITHAMVHDLRSPLSNSLFALQMLQKENLPTDSHQLLNLTYENTEKVLHLVNNILDVNRLESDAISVHPTAVSLPKLIDCVLKSQSPRAMAKNVTLIRQLPADLPPAWVDESLLERILQNLIDNSLKFSPIGSTIRVTAVLVNKHDPTHRQLHISVTDEGPGLPSNLADTIFEKFVTGPGRESGNGLGLAFCQMALTAHNQKIWVTSPAGNGVTFTFSLALPPQIPDDIYVENKWPDSTAAEANMLLSHMSPNW